MQLIINAMRLMEIVKKRVKRYNQEFTAYDIFSLLSTDYPPLMEYWQNTHHPSDTTS